MPDSNLTLLGVGSGGVEEMRASIDESAVCWGLCRFEFGNGVFKRQKVLFLHVNSDRCRALSRGRHNGHTSEVMRELRGEGESFHASLEVRALEDVSAEAIFRRTQHIFASDDIGDYSVEALLRDYRLSVSRLSNPRVQRHVPTLEDARERGRGRTPRRSTHLKSSSASAVTGREALERVANTSGSWNWVLVEADPVNLTLVGGGNDSIDGMSACLTGMPTDVLFGLLRLPFGIGRLRRVKFVFVHAIGEDTPAVRRGRLSTLRPKMRQALSKFAECPVTMEVTRCGDLTVENVVEKVRRSVCVDDAVIDDDVAEKNIYSVEAFLAALEREKRGRSPSPPNAPIATEIEKPVLPVQRDAKMSVGEAAQHVRAPGGPINWALFGATETMLRTPSASRGFSPCNSPASSPSRKPRSSSQKWRSCSDFGRNSRPEFVPRGPATRVHTRSPVTEFLRHGNAEMHPKLEPRTPSSQAPALMQAALATKGGTADLTVPAESTTLRANAMVRCGSEYGRPPRPTPKDAQIPTRRRAGDGLPRIPVASLNGGA